MQQKLTSQEFYSSELRLAPGYVHLYDEEL